MSTNNLPSTLTSRGLFVPLLQTTLVNDLNVKIPSEDQDLTPLNSLKSALKDKIIFWCAGKRLLGILAVFIVYFEICSEDDHSH